MVELMHYAIAISATWSPPALWSFIINAVTGVPSTVPSTVRFPQPCLKPLPIQLNSAPNPDASAEFS